jgi:2-polyprenyl-3-methyl-5-hydroxy-6-metoxy-1,4-benzoquinol methylase
MNKSFELCPVCNGKDFKYLSVYKGKSELFLNKKLMCCKNCTTVFISPMITKEELDLYYRAYWDSGIQNNDESALKNYFAQAKVRIEYTTAKIGSLKNKRILDIGAGHGFIFDVLKEIYDSDFVYTAVETDNSQQISLIQRGLNCSYTWNELPEQQYDLIILSHILEHLYNPQIFLIEIKKLLKQNGVLFIEVPNNDHLHKDILEPHLVIYNIDSIAKLFKNCDLDVLDMQSCGRLIKNIIPNSYQITEKKLKKKIKKLIPNLFLSMIQKRDINFINFYELRTYGNDRQWIRAIVKPN